MIARSTIALALVLCCSISNAENSVEIPLSKVWALEMPGTQKIVELEPDREKFNGMKTTDIIQQSVVYNTEWLLNVNNMPSHGRKAKKGFVIVGTGYEALKEANAILSEKKSRQENVPAGESLTLFFFSYSCPRSIQIDEISRSDKRIVVKYHFHAHNTRTSTANFALIPVGKFPAGKIEVVFEQLPDTSLDNDTAPLDRTRVNQTVSDSFVFGVSEQ